MKHANDNHNPAENPPDAHNTIAVGDTPILRDVAAAHEHLLAVRHAVATALVQVNPSPETVVALSIVSAGSNIQDQMVVFSPGGDKRHAATVAVVRLKAATAQLETLIASGAFDA